MGKRLNIHEITDLLDLLNDRYCDPDVEVATVNITLKTLGYNGYFVYNEKTGKVTWHVKRRKNE